MKLEQVLPVLVAVLFGGSTALAETIQLESPDGHLKQTFEVADDGSVTHALAVDGKPVISPSPVGFAGGRFAGVKRGAENSVWKPLWGKRSVVPDRYREAVIDLGGYQIKARAYDEGVAFRYVFPGAKPTGAEATAFHFAGDYTASVGAVVTSTAGDAALTVSDPDTTNPGKLINGTYALAQPIQVKATNAANPNTAFGPVTGASTPLTLLSWPRSISSDAVTIGFKQSIGANETLRAGNYGKTLTFTLS